MDVNRGWEKVGSRTKPLEVRRGSGSKRREWEERVGCE